MIRPVRTSPAFESAALLVCFLVVLGGCSLIDDGSGFEAPEGPRSEVLVLKNNTADSLYYDAIDQRVLPLILRVSFATPDVYPKIGPGQTVRFSRDEVYAWEEVDGYEPGGPISATVWRLVPDRESRTGFRVQALYHEVVQPGSIIDVGD